MNPGSTLGLGGEPGTAVSQWLTARGGLVAGIGAGTEPDPGSLRGMWGRFGAGRFGFDGRQGGH